MKSLFPFALLSFATVQAQQLAPSAPNSVAPTHEQLLERQRLAKDSAARSAAESQATPAGTQPASDPSKANKPQSLLAGSDYLSYGGMTTLVPKKAIIHIPQNLASRVGPAQKAELKSWREFYAANRGWITTMEVTRAQAQGKEPFTEEMTKSIANSSSIVVATFSGNLITVYPAPPKEAEASSTSNLPTKK
jgi:hypothetical protein